MYKIRKLHRTIFSTFYNVLQPNFTILINLGFNKFSAVLMNVPNSRVCLKGESSIIEFKNIILSRYIQLIFLLNCSSEISLGVLAAFFRFNQATHLNSADYVKWIMLQKTERRIESKGFNACRSGRCKTANFRLCSKRAITMAKKTANGC